MGKYKEPMSPQHPPQQQRPVFLNLLRIRQPVTAVLSILHRITGVLMVLLLPGLIYLLDLSLRGPAQFDQVAELLHSTPLRLLAIVLCWVFAHHLLAGVRHLIIDFDIGLSRPAARRSAWLVHGMAVGVALLAAGGSEEKLAAYFLGNQNTSQRRGYYNIDGILFFAIKFHNFPAKLLEKVGVLKHQGTLEMARNVIIHKWQGPCGDSVTWYLQLQGELVSRALFQSRDRGAEPRGGCSRSGSRTAD